MRLLTLNGRLRCPHPVGVVAKIARQSWVKIEGHPILVADDPIGRDIGGCTNANPIVGILPCLKTVSVKEGYSSFLHIDGHRVCLDSLKGLTNGSPIGTVEYEVAEPGQTLVRGSA